MNNPSIHPCTYNHATTPTKANTHQPTTPPPVRTPKIKNPYPTSINDNNQPAHPSHRSYDL
ncbi:hypothetical protein BDV38DRAFT_259058, partial [Aspergillus pseudotamarii]